jgi:transposase
VVKIYYKLKLTILPHDLELLSYQVILTSLRKTVKRAVGLRKIQELKRAAKAHLAFWKTQKMAKLELRT